MEFDQLGLSLVLGALAVALVVSVVIIGIFVLLALWHRRRAGRRNSRISRE